MPHENVLTRPVGVGKRWVSVSTMAAAGSALVWAHQTLFRDLDFKAFLKLVARVSRRKASDAREICFDNWLAGSRTSLEQHRAAITGLTLSTSREEILTALADSLARDSAARIELLKKVNPIKIDRRVLLTGGASGPLADLLHRDWQGSWTFHEEDEATLRGVAALVPA
jgi:sugar (pentulose or hexulose) kinase